MSNENNTRDENGQRTAGPSRRVFLRATAGALATGVSLSGATGVGLAVASNGIQTPWLERDGNLIKDPSGNKVILRGVNIADPKRIDVTASARGKNAVQTVDYAASEEEGWFRE
jgi:endoglucanase